MDDITVTYYEVHVLSKDGWTLHARYLSNEQKEALTEAKAAEARLAAATKVIRSVYVPRTNSEERTEIYTSRLTAGEVGQQIGGGVPGRAVADNTARSGGPKQKAKASAESASRAKPRPVTPTKPTPTAAPKTQQQSAAAVFGHIIGIMATATLIGGLMTTLVGAVLGEHLSFISPTETAQRGFLYGTFLVFFLLVALPWIISFVRSTGDISFGFSTGRKERPAQRPVQSKLRDEPPPLPPPPAVEAEPELLEPLPESDMVDEAEAEAECEAQELPEGGSEAPPEQPDPATGKISRRRLESARRPLVRFLRGIVTALSETRPNLDSYERFGIGLLIIGAGNEVAERTRLQEVERRALLLEAMGVLNRSGPRAAALLDELEEQAGEPRAARMIQAGFAAMRQFAKGGQDFLAAVLTALESWNRPAGATGSGVVAALVIEMWPLDDSVGAMIRTTAQARGGAVLGMAEGVVLLFPGAVRAVEVALELRGRLPQASRMGVDAVEAASEEEAVKCVASARAACQEGGSGRILVTMAVRGLCSRSPFRFRNIVGVGGLELAELETDSVATERWTETVTQDANRETPGPLKDTPPPAPVGEEPALLSAGQDEIKA